MNGLYVLNARGEPVPEPDPRKWGRWLEEHGEDRVLARSDVAGTVVSTVFLGLDHQYAHGPPILWETLIVAGKHRGYMQRYTTEYAALNGHSHIVRRLKSGDFAPYEDDFTEVVRLARKLAAEKWGATEPESEEPRG